MDMEVLSVVAKQIMTIQTALASGGVLCLVWEGSVLFGSRCVGHHVVVVLPK